MKAFVALSTLLCAAQAAYVAPYAAAYGAAPLAYAAGPAAYAAPAAPVAYAAAPAPAALPAALAAPSSQFQAQDELGNINYGYSNINSNKQEVGNAYGGVVGSYSYIDANGIPQRVDYVADELGFRVKATNLPVAPAAVVAPEVALPVAPVYTGVAPAPVQDTPEVAEAKAAHLAALEEAKRTKRSVLPAATAPLFYGAYPYNAAYNLGYNAYPYGLATAAYAAPAIAAPAAYAAAPAAYAAAPVAAVAPAAYAAETISAPAAVEATLTKVKLNPGHAVAYRVD